MNAKRVYPFSKKLKLRLREKPPKRRVETKPEERRCAESCSNGVWLMDFVHDQLAGGWKLRIPTLIDTFSRFLIAGVPRFSFQVPDMITVLDRVCGDVGYPASIRMDQSGASFSRDLDL